MSTSLPHDNYINNVEETKGANSKVLRELTLLIFGFLVSLSFLLVVTSKLRIPWAFDEMSGGLRGSIISSWNKASDTLGSSEYILLPKYQGVETGCGLFLVVALIVLTLAVYLIIKSRFIPGLLAVLVPLLAVSIISAIEIPFIYYIFSFAAMLAAAVIMKTDSAWQGLLVPALVFLFAFSIISIKDLVAPNLSLGGISDRVQAMYYGEDPLGHGDLSVHTRKEFADDDIALRVKMSKPQSTYLRGFVGSKFDGRSWSDLTNSIYYKNRDLFDSLDESGFEKIGQLAQASILASPNKDAFSEDIGNIITIENLGSDSRYAFLTYDLINEGTLLDATSKGDSIVPNKYGRLKRYSYVSMDNQVKNWTDIAGRFFSSALGNSDETISEYLIDESHYNNFVYDNYTSIGLKERELLAQSVGSKGDQSKGHLDYKLAISGIRNYLEKNFVYSREVSSSSNESKNEIERFISSGRGFDVHYASLATLLFRYYGIPARYVEGYIITPDDQFSSEGEILVKKNAAHAWTEIYVDGIGFVPLEVTPEYYGMMEEADMSIGISNEKLLNDYQSQYGNNTSNQNKDEPETSEPRSQISRYVTYGIIIFLIALGLIVLIILLRKLAKLLHEWMRRRNAFYKASPKEAVASIYGYMESNGYVIDDETVRLGNLAAYSQCDISEEDREMMLRKYKERTKPETNAGNNKLKFSVLMVLIMLTVLFGTLLSSCDGNDSKNYSDNNLTKVIDDVCNQLMEEIPNPTAQSAGGDLMILALKKSGADIPDSYYTNYYDNIRALVKRSGGVLSDTKYTEYERVSIGVNAIGKDPRDIEGYDITTYIDDYDKVLDQGINAAWYALISKNVVGFNLQNESRYVDHIKNSILTKEYDGTGLSDYLSIGLQALSFYDDDPEIKKIISDGIDTLSEYQLSDGSLGNCESTAMCIIALSMNGVDCISDERFIKDGNTLWDGLMVYYLGDGQFCHTNDIKEKNLLATEQALMSLDSLRLYKLGEKLYE